MLLFSANLAEKLGGCSCNNYNSYDYIMFIIIIMIQYDNCVAALTISVCQH